MAPVAASFQMWATFAMIVVAFALYSRYRIPMVLTSVLVLATLIVFFDVFPVPGPEVANRLTPKRILAGFGNPALITVLALLVVGQGLTRTGVLDRAADIVIRAGKGEPGRTVPLTLIVVLAISAFLNNIPVVVIFIPIMQALAGRLGRPASRLMIPLSYAAILGGMTTLIGSSTNLLVASSLIEMGLPAFSFFDFSIPGLVLAGAGLVYVLLFAPRLIPDRQPDVDGDGPALGGRQFVARIEVAAGSALVGKQSVGGLFPGLGEITVQLARRGERTILPPFEDLVLEAGDRLHIAATRNALTAAIKADPGLFASPAGNGYGGGTGTERRPRALAMAEVMVSPTSRLTGHSVDYVNQRGRGLTLAGIQRRSRMTRARIGDIRLEAGDVLLLVGEREAIRRLRGNPDVVLMEWSTTDLPALHLARRATGIFLVTVIMAAAGLVPIVGAAVIGAAGMIAGGCLTVREAARAIDRTVVMTIGAALGLGVALEDTGGAPWLAHMLITVFEGAGPATVLSAFFLLVALLSNLLNTKACAVLFTPIAVEIAFGLGISPMPFAVAVVFAANCSFASPIGYQTNLLVMGPGNYRFTDFFRVGLPLILVVWLAFSLFVPFWYGL